MDTSDYFVSVIAPLYNHSEIIESFVADIMQILRQNYTYFELVLINDGSDDDTAKKVINLLKEYECIRLISLSRHFSTEIAISSGLDAVIGDFVVVLLPECDPPLLIPPLIEKCKNGKDILIGVSKNRLGQPLWVRIGANLFYLFCHHLLKIPLTKNATQFRVFSRQVVNAITQVQDKYRYLHLLSFYIGYKYQTFVYEPIRRYKVSPTKSLIEYLNLALQIIVVNSVHPLRFASYLSILASIFNIAYIGYVVLVYLIKEKVAEGWVTLSIQNAVMFFFISIILGILCEYVGLIFAKSKGWAAYYIAEEKNSSVLISEQKQRNVVQDSKSINI